MMICATWNVRGMNDPFKTKEVRKFINSNKIDVCGLLETRVRSHTLVKSKRSLGMSGVGLITIATLLGVEYG